MNNLNIFESLAQDSSADEFIPLLQNENQTDFANITNKEIENNKNIFESLSENASNQSFSFLDTAKDVLKQIGAKGLQGFIGSYGNTLDAFGLQTKENILPGQEKRHQSQSDILERLNKGEKVSAGELEQLSGDEELLPDYARLPTSEDAKKAIEKVTGIGEGKTPLGRIAGRASEFVGEGLAIPGGGIKALASLGTSGAAGQSLREIGAPESLSTGVEIAGTIVPSMIQGKVAPTSKETKEIADAGRALGLTEKQIAPLIQSENKVANLSKVARKGTRTKKTFASIKESLGEAYNSIKNRPDAKVKLANADQIKLRKEFGNIRNELAKTLAPSPDREAALNFIETSLQTLRNTNVTPEFLINFWQDINKSVKWNSINGGKKALAKLKEPLSQVLEKTSPKLAGDFELTNKLYSKYAQVSKKLKPDLVDAFVNKGELIGATTGAMALIHGNPWILSGVAAESSLRILAREMLINPYFQNLSSKLVKNFNQSSLKGLTNLVNNAKEFMERKYPEENWSFLIAED